MTDYQAVWESHHIFMIDIWTWCLYLSAVSSVSNCLLIWIYWCLSVKLSWINCTGWRFFDLKQDWWYWKCDLWNAFVSERYFNKLGHKSGINVSWFSCVGSCALIWYLLEAVHVKCRGPIEHCNWFCVSLYIHVMWHWRDKTGLYF